MEESNIKFTEVTFGEYRDGIDISDSDKYGIMEYALLEPRRKAFLSNPYIKDDNYVVLGLASADGVIVGRNMYFPTLFRADGEIIPCLGGSTLEVYKDSRNTSASTYVITYPITNRQSDAIMYSDFSEDGEKTYRALRFCGFKLHKMMRPYNLRFFFEMIGFKGRWAKVISVPFNIILNCFAVCEKFFQRNKFSDYKVQEVTTIPEWVEDIVKNDSHKYMEYHDRNWFQWNLDNKFSEHKRNVTKFYTISNGTRNIGFFMIKERFGGIPIRGISPMLTGTVVEWGTCDSSLLDEYNINILALRYFSKDVDLVNVYSDNADVIRKLKRHFFIHHNYHHIKFKDLTKRYKDAKDQNLWRLRFGCSDSVLN